MDEADKERIAQAAERIAAPLRQYADCITELIAALVDCMDVIWEEFHTTPADNVDGTKAEKPYDRALAALAAYNRLAKR